MSDPLRVLLPGFDGPELPSWLADRLDRGLAGVCLFGSNIESPRQVRRLTDSIRAHNPLAVIAVDEEGGDVTRLHYDQGAPTTGNAWLGRYDDLNVTARAGASIARELRRVGISLNFAPSADINSNDANPVIGVRSFGSDPRRVAAHTAAWVEGHQAEGVAACAKHFPGHGDTDLDSHLALPTVDVPLEVLRRRELLPFQEAIDAGVWSVMSSHILLPQVDPSGPATFSSYFLRELLRGELGFDGVVVSDALDMAGASGDIAIPAAAVRAVAAGCDLLCIGTDNTAEQVDQIEAALAAACAGDDGFAESMAAAAIRMRGLADRVAAPEGSVARLAERFATSIDDGVGDPGAAFSLTERGRRVLGAYGRGGRWIAVVLDTRPNSAAGTVPWGLAAAVRAQDEFQVVHVDESSAGEVIGSLPAEVPVAVVGKDNHRHRWIRAAVDGLRARRDDVLVVDMGWPDQSQAYADVATYGASRRLGVALLDLLGARARTEVAR